jgi:thiol peroxidase
MASITLGGKPAYTVGDLPKVGSEAPAFIAIKSDMSSVSSDDLRGKKVVLNIFPSIDTGVCATSVREFNKRASAKENVTVVCMSLDLPFAQKRFCGAEGIDSVVVASGYRDGGAFGDAYGVRIADGAFEGLYARAVVVVDEEGKVLHTEMVPEIGHEPNYDAAWQVL